MSIKLVTIKQMRKKILKIISKILRNYNSIDFNIEIARDNYTKEEIEKIITLKLKNY